MITPNLSHNKSLKIIGAVSTFFFCSLLLSAFNSYFRFENELVSWIAASALGWGPVFGLVHVLWSLRMRHELDGDDKVMLVCSVLNVLLGVAMIVLIIQMASYFHPMQNFVVPDSTQ